MKTATLVLVMLAIVLAMTAPSQAAGADMLTDLSSKLTLNLSNIQSLDGSGNQTALTASWKLVEKDIFGLAADVLIAPDFESFAKWGIGVSANIKGGIVDLKAGVGYFDDSPVIYVSFPLTGGR